MSVSQEPHQNSSHLCYMVDVVHIIQHCIETSPAAQKRVRQTTDLGLPGNVLALLHWQLNSVEGHFQKKYPYLGLSRKYQIFPAVSPKNADTVKCRSFSCYFWSFPAWLFSPEYRALPEVQAGLKEFAEMTGVDITKDPLQVPDTQAIHAGAKYPSEQWFDSSLEVTLRRFTVAELLGPIDAANAVEHLSI